MSDFRIGHMEGLESPWGNAGGVIKKVEELEKMVQTGVGWAEVGSHCIEKRLGNGYDPLTGEQVLDLNTGLPIRLYHHDSDTGETHNSLGMPGQGLDQLVTEVPEMLRIAKSRPDHPKQVVFNVAPVTSEPVAETKELVGRLYGAGAKFILVNAGCPNVVTEDGGRKEILSYNPEMLGAVLGGLKEVVQKYDPVFVRVSPYQSRGQMRDAFKQIRDSEVVSAVFLPNTWPNHHPLNRDGEDLIQVPGGLAGKSGPAMAEEAAQQTFWATSLLRGTGIDVVTSSSITTGSELARRMRIGAVAGAGTTFYYQPEFGWAEDTDRLLNDFHRFHSPVNQPVH